jgi:hypothetical protein
MSDFDTGIGKTVGIYAIVLGLLYIGIGAAKIVLQVSGIGRLCDSSDVSDGSKRGC